MTVATEAGYTWTDGTHARVLHDGNTMQARVIAASSETTEGPASAAGAGDTVDRWKPFANSVQDPMDFAASSWTPNGVSISADGRTLAELADTGEHRVSTPITFTAVEWVVAFKVQRQTAPEVFVNAYDGTTNFSAFFNLSSGTVGSKAAGVEAAMRDIDRNTVELRLYFTPVAATGSIQINLADGSEVIGYSGNTDQTVRVLRAAAHPSEAYIYPTGYEAEAQDTIAIAAHNVGLGLGTLTFEHDANADDTYTALGSVSPSDNSPVMFFFTPVTSLRWRVRVQRCVLPEIGVVRVGSSLVMQRSFYGGFTPSAMARNTEVIGNQSGSGELLGRSRKRTTLNIQMPWENLTYSWVRSNLDGPNGLIQSAEAEPMFAAWRPSENSDVAYIMRAETTPPVAQGVSNLWSFSMSGEVHAYE